jgi:hypothetical protein
VNITLNVILVPAASVSDGGTFARENPDPESVRLGNVSLTPPMFVILIVCELLIPTVTLPKLALDGMIVMPDDGTTAGASAAGLLRVPVPLRETKATTAPPETRGIEAECSEAERGVNTTLNVMLVPAASVSDGGTFARVNPEPETVNWVNATRALPLFVILIA